MTANLLNASQGLISLVRDRLATRHAAIVAGIFIVGTVARLSVWTYTTLDTPAYLLPWYAYAKEHGWSSLGVAFTNYAPLYTYFLVFVAQFDGLLPPLLLIKTISFVFEFATALLAYRFVRRVTERSDRALWAFGLTWLAPAVLYNGAMWGQADALWSFFCLLSVYLFVIGRSGVLAFSLAFAAKAQGVFVGPFALGAILRRRESLLSFVLVPLTYVALAFPVLIAGRSLRSVMLVYADQAGTFRELSKNAANFWALVPFVPYLAGVAAGLIAAAAAGILLAIWMERSKRADIGFLLVAACVSLLMTPYLLPKMHERYFYAFEITALVLACCNPRYWLVAFVAQLNAVFSYIAYDHNVTTAIPFAAAQNGLLLAFLVQDLRARAQAEFISLRSGATYVVLAFSGLAALWLSAERAGEAWAEVLALGVLTGLVGLLGLILLRMATSRPAWINVVAQVQESVNRRRSKKHPSN
ncbi:MAG TPA: hypothetical protein VGL66_00400 [Caulobacteraceae bacterium]|jgi:Gpi18-like mannosyltransferase